MVEFVDHSLREFNPADVPVLLKAARVLLDAARVDLGIALPFGLPVTAPQSGLSSIQVHDLEITASGTDEQTVVTTRVESDITSLCPCSQAVSDYGAHNQRSRVSLAVDRSDDRPYPVSISRLVDLIRSVGSAPVMPLIKRVDERHLTMQAFDRPAFVEDIVRDASVELRAIGVGHTITCRNIESIHSHDAVASLRWAAGV